MKKISSLLLTAFLMLSLVACSGDVTPNELGNSADAGENVQASDETSAEEAEEEKDEEEPLITDAAGREEEIYTEWLLDGNYEKIVEGTTIKPKNERTYAHLEDLNGDGVKDLLFTIPSYGTIPSFVLTIYNGKVVCVASETYTNAERYQIMTDTETGKQVVVLSYDINTTAKNPLAERSETVYDFEGDKLIQRIKISKFWCNPSVSGGAEEIEKIKGETELYNELDGSYFWWKIDEEYVSADEYEAATNRYNRYDMRMELGSYSDPLALNKE